MILCVPPRFHADLTKLTVSEKKKRHFEQDCIVTHLLLVGISVQRAAAFFWHGALVNGRKILQTQF